MSVTVHLSSPSRITAIQLNCVCMQG